MPDTPRPQDASADEPVTDVDQERPPTPQGRTDNASADEPGPSTDTLDDTSAG